MPRIADRSGPGKRGAMRIGVEFDGYRQQSARIDAAGCLLDVAFPVPHPARALAMGGC